MAKKEVKSKNNRHFFKDFKAELKKVIWPTPKQLLNSTTAVIVIVLITAAIVFVLDLAFETLNKQGVNRLKNVVSNTTVENTTDESTNINEESNADDATNNTDNKENNEDSNENKDSDNTDNNDENVENSTQQSEVQE